MISRFLRAGIIAAGAIFLSAFAAQAADLRAPYKSPAFVAPAYFSWSGFYIGINGGYGFGKSSWTGPPSTGDFNVKGPIVGATLGYNYQTGSWVWGLEADADYSAIKGSTTNTCGAGGCETSNTWLATGRARIGYAWDRWLPYITGGAAYGNEKASFAGNSESKTKLGWTAGLGVEYAFLGAWSAKLEYLYVDLGTWSCSAATCGAASDVKFNANLVRVGVNYRF